MRDIKFRAWDESEKQFWYFTLQEILERKMSYRGSWDTKVMQGKKTQYTGLKDINGKEIYEGDIIRNVEKHSIHIVGYRNGAFTRSFQNGNIHLLYDTFIVDGKMVDYDVIGNTFEVK